MPSLIDSCEIEIDLAFTGFSKDNCEGFENASEIYLLNDSKFWAQELANWIEYLRKNKEVSCPDLIRKANNFSIVLEFIDDFAIQKLNKQWRNKEEITDVLSFPVFDENMVYFANQCLELGDIVVSVPMAMRQAGEHQHSLAFELRWLISHGLLHLLGWDHPDSNSLQHMLGFQEQLLKISSNLQIARASVELNT